MYHRAYKYHTIPYLADVNFSLSCHMIQKTSFSTFLYRGIRKILPLRKTIYHDHLSLHFASAIVAYVLTMFRPCRLFDQLNKFHPVKNQILLLNCESVFFNAILVVSLLDKQTTCIKKKISCFLINNPRILESVAVGMDVVVHRQPLYRQRGEF